MNLADAIRKAAKETGTTLAMTDSSKSSDLESQPSAVIYKLPANDELSDSGVEEIPESEFEELETSHLFTIGETSSQGFVKIEVHVPPEQLNKVLRSVVASHHSILTLREAANYLRVTPSRLEELAKAGEVPGFLVDGKWRFSRTRLESLQAPTGIDKEKNS